MAVFTTDTFLTVAPEFKKESQDLVGSFVAMAKRRLSPVVWGIYYQDGVSLLAAHLITVYKRRGQPGAATTMKTGDIEMQFSPSLGKSGYESTSYGIEFLELRKLVVIKPMVI